MINAKFLSNFLLDLGPPLGGDEYDNIWDAAKITSKFKIKTYQIINK